MQVHSWKGYLRTNPAVEVNDRRQPETGPTATVGLWILECISEAAVSHPGGMTVRLVSEVRLGVRRYIAGGASSRCAQI